MQWILRFRVFIIIILAVLLILSAITFSVLRAVLPYAIGYKNEIQQEISEQIGLPVEIQSIDAAIHWFSPRLKLIDVTIHDKDKTSALFVFKEAFVQLDVIASIIHREFIVDDIGMVGAEISIIKIAENEWVVQGINISNAGSDEVPTALLYMLQNSDYLLHSSRILYQDRTQDDFSLTLNNINIDVDNDFNHHDIKVSVALPSSYGHDLAIVSTLTGDLKTLSGDIYIEANKINIDKWNQKFKLISKYHIDTTLDANLWLSLDGGNIKDVTAQISAKDYYINNNETSKGWETNYLSLNLRYTEEKGFSNIAVSDFYFGEYLKPQWPHKVNFLASEDESDYFLDTNFFNLTDVEKIAQILLSEDNNSVIENIQNYNLQADVYNLNLRVPKWIFAKKTPIKDRSYVDAVNQEAAEYQPDADQVNEVTNTDKVLSNRVGDDNKITQSQTSQISFDIGQVKLNRSELDSEIWDEIDLDVTLKDFSIYESENRIQLSGFDTYLKLNKGIAIFDIVSRDTKIDIPSLFRGPLHADVLQGDLTINVYDSNWLLRSDNLQFKNKHINTYSRLDIQVYSDEDIFLDIQTDFYDAYGQYSKHYLPVGILSDGLVDWLDMAVTDGYVPSGQFILHGDFQDFPYENNDGVFQVLFSADNVNMRFLNNWPKIKDTSAELKFNNKSLHIKNASAKTKDIELLNGDIEIKDLMAPNLTVKLDGQAINEDIQGYIWKSPLDDVLGDSMRLFQFSGNSKLHLTLDVPLEDKGNDDKGREVAIDGHLEFINTNIYYPALGYEINTLNGDLNFTKETIYADPMSAKIQDEVVSVSALTRKGKHGNEVVFHLEGKLKPDYLLKHYDWVPEDWFSGKTFWSLDFEVPYQPKDYLVQINAESDLDGIAIRLSDNVEKTASEKIKFNSKIDVLNNDGLSVEVTADIEDKLDVSKNQKDQVLSLFATRADNDLWNLNVNSPYIIGKGEFTEGLKKETTVNLDIKKIDLYNLLYKENSNDSTDQLDPASIPQLNINIEKLYWNEWAFRNVLLETDWHKHGMLINKFSIDGPAMSFDARGTWLKSWRNTQDTVLHGTLTSSNFGDTLSGLGFKRSINKGAVTATFDAKWPAAPYSLSWSKMKGNSFFTMKKGELLDVEPGAGGRLLGLLNIFELTNRLAFDFDDVTKKGFSFDYINGDFEFSNGHGALKNFIVSAPAADVNMFGSIGLLKQDYGLLMHVKPHTDTLTFAGGTLLGGVAVGAGLALIQKVFDLGVLGHTVYSITGSWENPEIERIVQKTLDEEEEF